jgi:hypothetical protein
MSSHFCSTIDALVNVLVFKLHPPDLKNNMHRAAAGGISGFRTTRKGWHGIARGPTSFGGAGVESGGGGGANVSATEGAETPVDAGSPTLASSVLIASVDTLVATASAAASVVCTRMSACTAVASRARAAPPPPTVAVSSSAARRTVNSVTLPTEQLAGSTPSAAAIAARMYA